MYIRARLRIVFYYYVVPANCYCYLFFFGRTSFCNSRTPLATCRGLRRRGVRNIRGTVYNANRERVIYYVVTFINGKPGNISYVFFPSNPGCILKTNLHALS